MGCPGDGECYVCLPYRVLLLVKVDIGSHSSYVSWWGVRWWGVRVMEGDGECYVCLPHRVLLLVKYDTVLQIEKPRA